MLLVENDSVCYSYYGYVVMDFYWVDLCFGSNDDFCVFVIEVYVCGLGVIQDIVFNYIGVGYWWMVDLLVFDWLNQLFVLEGFRYVEIYYVCMMLQDFYVVFSDWQCFIDGWFIDCMLDFNQCWFELVIYLMQMMLWWIESCGLFGLCIDIYFYFDCDFLICWLVCVMQEYLWLNIVGEEWSFYFVVVVYWQCGKCNYDGYVLYMLSMMDFLLQFSLLVVLIEDDGVFIGLNWFYEGLVYDFVYFDLVYFVFFEGNYDMLCLFLLFMCDVGLMKMVLVYFVMMWCILQFFYGIELLMESFIEWDDGCVCVDMLGGWKGDVVDVFIGVSFMVVQCDMQDWMCCLFIWCKSVCVVYDGVLMQYVLLDGCYVFFCYDVVCMVMVVLNKNVRVVELLLGCFVECVVLGQYVCDVLSGQVFMLGSIFSVLVCSFLILEFEC